MRAIAVLNQKGGVGKTTTVVNIAAALAGAGLKVVVVDLDPQAHLTIHLGLEPEAVEFGSYNVLTQSGKFEEAILFMRPNLWLMPANIDLVGAETELVSVVGRETILREAMKSIEDKFDYLLIDCPPSLGLLTLNALAAADEILIPLQPHFLALQGFGKLLQTVDLVGKRINPKLKVKGVLLCMFDGRVSLCNEVKADIEHFLDDARRTDCAWGQARVLPVYIRRNIKLAEAPSYGKTIFEYEPNCHGAQDYRQVAEFIHGQVQPVCRPDAESHIAERVEEESAQSSEQAEELPCAGEEADEHNMPARSDTDVRTDASAERNQHQPSIEIRSISQPDSQTPASELSQTPSVQEQGESQESK